MSLDLTLIEDGKPVHLDATLEGDRVRIDPASLQAELGWTLKAEGLCRDDRCVLVADRDALASDAGIDLEHFAALLERPLALDREEMVAALGTAAGVRAAGLATLAAPDFTLPDLSGKLHSLSDHRGKKVLLIAYASW